MKRLFWRDLSYKLECTSLYSGLGLDMGLLEWLQHYTFPMEMSLVNDSHKAREAYGRVVETTLAWGTTSAAYHATIGRQTTEILCDVAEDLGQRALVGKVSLTIFFFFLVFLSFRNKTIPKFIWAEDDRRGNNIFSRITWKLIDPRNVLIISWSMRGRILVSFLSKSITELFQVCMNRNAYAGYQETTKESLEETELFVASTFARKSK